MKCIFDRLLDTSFADGQHDSGGGRHVWHTGGTTFAIAASYQATEICTLLQRNDAAVADACFKPWVATFTMERDPSAMDSANIEITFYKHTHGNDTFFATVAGTSDQLEIRWGDGNVWRQTHAFAGASQLPRALSRTRDAVTAAGGVLGLQRQYLAVVTPHISDRGACRISPGHLMMLC